MTSNADLRIKSLIGTGAVVLDDVSSPYSINIYVQNVVLTYAEPNNFSLVYDGSGPDLLLRSLAGVNNASLVSNATAVTINTTSVTFDVVSAGTGVNLVYQDHGPSAQLKSLAVPNDDLLTINLNVDSTVELGLRSVGLQSGTTVQSNALPNVWYLATFNSMAASPVSTSPYWTSTLGTASPNWTTVINSAGRIVGNYTGTSGNDDAYFRLDFAVPNTILPNLDSNKYVLLSIFGHNGTSIVNVVDDQYFYMTPNGGNLMRRVSDGYGVGEVSVRMHTGTPQFVVGALHNMNANIVFGSGFGNLDSNVLTMMNNPASSLGLAGSKLLVQKFH